jgi:hypothetical protein
MKEESTAISSELAANPQQISSPAPRHGERAAKIRRLATSYPELSQAAIAKRVGCTIGNVYGVLKRFLGDTSEGELREFQENKADVYDALQRQCLESVTQAKLTKTSAPALVTAAAILEDKARLVRGQATGINVQVLLDVAGMIRRDSEQ